MYVMNDLIFFIFDLTFLFFFFNELIIDLFNLNC